MISYFQTLILSLYLLHLLQLTVYALPRVTSGLDTGVRISKNFSRCTTPLNYNRTPYHQVTK